ncbi:hypothetical protein [Cellulophaga sp. Hel_I_12]|uniref:hypothetical protein n=1 Tax=Cellulophaga sp. Hel_I_12 TaxID=1249972 RepID=UPI0006462DE8|nr:hypothetical protein [Cellulophaga sp. Hel_I_12]
MNLYHHLFTEFKGKQLGYSAIAIIGQSCLGSIAAMLILKSAAPKVALLLELFLVTMVCMSFNAAVLAQLKPKITFNLLLLSVAFSIAIIASHMT